MAQETFIKAYQAFDTFKGEAKISTWLHRIAINVCLEFQRSRKNARRNKTLVLDPVHESLVGHQFHPGVSVENQERSEILYNAIEQLPETQKIAFILKKVDGLSQKEVSQIMGKSEGSIESLLNRAKMNLRKTLRKYYEAHG